VGNSATPEAGSQDRWRSKKLYANCPVIYLDTEIDSDITHPPRLDDKIIVIGLKPVLSRVILYKEWELGERDMLLHGLRCLERYLAKAGCLEIVGMGILTFDIPLIIARGMAHGLHEELNILMHSRVYKMDLLQIARPFYGWRFPKGTEIAKLVGVEIPHSNKEIPQFYREGRYDEIIEHIEADLISVEKLDLCLRRGWRWTKKDFVSCIQADPKEGRGATAHRLRD